MIFGRVFKTVTLGLGLSLAAGSVNAATVIPQKGWKLLWTTSQELSAENGAAVNAFDGNPKTIWHTEWSRVNKAGPHEIRIDLGNTYSISGFKYLPRPTTRFSWSHNGRIAKYALYVGTSPTNLGAPVATGTFGNDGQEKMVIFNARSGRYVRLVALSEVNGNPWASAAELNFLGSATSGAAATASPTPAAPSAPVNGGGNSSTGGYLSTSATKSQGGTWWSDDSSVDWSSMVARSSGQVYRVASPAQLKSISSSIRPGDVVLFENGVYRDVSFEISSVGTADRPVIYAARTPGQVVFEGADKRTLNIKGAHNLIGGFKFRNCKAYVVQFRGASHNRFTDSSFLNCGASVTDRVIDVTYGSNGNRLDHLVIDNSQSMGLAVALPRPGIDSFAESRDTRIDRNLFKNFPSRVNGGAGPAPIQIGQWVGDDSRTWATSNALVEHNQFINVNPINSKSSGEVYRFNYFKNSGGIVLRGGDNKVVDANTFVNSKVAIHVYGRSHKIVNNIIEGSDVGILMPKWGDYQITASGKMSHSPPTGKNLIAFNTVVGFSGIGIEIGRDWGYKAAGWVIARGEPSDSLVVNNILSSSEGTLLRVVSGSKIGVRRNLLHAYASASLGDMGIDAIEGNPNFSANYSPGISSVVIDAAVPTSGVVTDFSGGSRVSGTQADLGAIERR